MAKFSEFPVGLTPEHLVGLDDGVNKKATWDAVMAPVVGASRLLEREPLWDPIAASHDAAVAASLASLAADGGGTLILGKAPVRINDLHMTADRVMIRGQGSSQNHGPSIVEVISAGGGISFAGPSLALATSSGENGGFTVDGNNVATSPLRFGVCVGATFKNIDVVKAADTGLLLQGTQNCEFHEVNVQDVGNDCARVTDGAGSNFFYKCEFGQPGRYHLNLVAGANIGSGWPYPIYNIWDGCIFEYTKSTGIAVIRQNGGNVNGIRNCLVVGYSGQGVHAGAIGPHDLVRIEDGQFVIIGGSLSFNVLNAASCAVRISGNSSVYQSALTNFLAPNTAVVLDGNLARGYFDPILVNVTTWMTLLNGALYFKGMSIPRLTDVQASAGIGGGVVNGKIAVFDHFGVVKGWIPLYNAMA